MDLNKKELQWKVMEVEEKNHGVKMIMLLINAKRIIGMDNYIKELLNKCEKREIVKKPSRNGNLW